MQDTNTIFEELRRIADRPVAFQHYTSPQLWNDPHISKGMLDAHLDPSHDAASFRGEFIDKGVSWMAWRFGITKGRRYVISAVGRDCGRPGSHARGPA